MRCIECLNGVCTPLDEKTPPYGTCQTCEMVAIVKGGE